MVSTERRDFKGKATTQFPTLAECLLDFSRGLSGSDLVAAIANIRGRIREALAKQLAIIEHLEREAPPVALKPNADGLPIDASGICP